MAPLPVPFTDNTREAIAEALSRGLTPPEIALKLEPNDPKARKYLRRRIWRMGATDERLAEALVTRARVKMLFALGVATDGLTRRAKNGNIQAVKLLYEASGLHNPKVQHQHSGEITITLDMPRPSFGSEGEITDAEVVEVPADPGQEK
jgi:hypothetical protein